MARVLEEPQVLSDALRAVRNGTAWRTEPLARKVAHAQRLGSDVTLASDPAIVDKELEERHVGSVDLLPALWLRRAIATADAVARLDAPRGKGTGFLVSPWLLLTNHHVVESPDQAASTSVRFRYEEDRRGRISRVRNYLMDPGRFFLTSPRDLLDFTLVALRPLDDGKSPGEVFGQVPLIGMEGKILLGGAVNIIQHPGGRPREVAVRNNRLLNLEDKRRLVYETDTEPGSSGAPVLNDRWEVVALHHRAVEAVDDQGRKIDRNGDPLTDDTPEELRNWYANAGIRVSAIVADIESRQYTQEEQALVDELRAQGG